MPAAEVELDDRDESFDGVLDLGDGEEHLGVAHETNESNSQQKRTFRALRHKDRAVCLPLLGYPLEHASRFEDEGWQDNPAEVGSGSELGDDV